MLYFDVFVVSHTHKHVDYVCSVFHCHTYIYTSACASVCFVLFYCKRNHYSKCLENAVIRCVFTPRKGRGKKRERERAARAVFVFRGIGWRPKNDSRPLKQNNSHFEYLKLFGMISYNKSSHKAHYTQYTHRHTNAGDWTMATMACIQVIIEKQKRRADKSGKRWGWGETERIYKII